MLSVLKLNRLCTAKLVIILLSIITETTSINSSTDFLNTSSINQIHDIVAQFNLSTGLSYGSEKSNPIKPGSYFTHLAFDAKRNVYYAGATNIILQLNENLRVLKHAITGPKSDSPQCHTSGCSSEVETQFTNNYNKILVVAHSNIAGNQYGSIYGNDNGGYGFGGMMGPTSTGYLSSALPGSPTSSGDDKLIACGSIHQGACEIFTLQRFPDTPQSISLPLAANDENSTTYAFVGPSNYHTWNKEDVLYVGTTFTNVGEYRHDVPAISSRKLDDLNYAEFSIQQSILNIDVKYRDHFLVDYVYGFNTSEYAYFLMVQKKSHLAEEAGYITRLARICISDSNYDSYTEITIQCQAAHSNTNYNILRDAKITVASQRLARQLEIKTDDIVLVAAFSPSKEITNQPQDKSAVCIYSLKEIEDIFLENIHMCFNGTTKDRNLGYISGPIDDGRCPIANSFGNIFNFCSVGLKISGVAPISALALFHFDNVSVTSVTTATTGPHSLAFLGTSDGMVKKVLISGESPGEYEQVTVDPSNAILPDTMLSGNKEFLYALSVKSITKLRVEHCSIYTNCQTCLESRDPFCGWCSLEKRCTVRSACQKDTNAARWLSLGSGQQCIDFESIVPDHIPITDLTQVKLVIRTLPEPFNANYRCVFGNSTPIDAEVSMAGLTCRTPALDQRPVIELNNDHVLVPLSVRSSETNKDFVSRSFAFFDCSRHETCRKCVQSQWGCNWCIFDNKCVHSKDQCRNTENVITKGESCPHFKKQSNRILLPVQVTKEIRLEIENLPKPKNAHSGFSCTVRIEGSNMLIPARVEENKYVVCQKTSYNYENKTHEYEAQVDVTWNHRHYIDTATVVLYKCDILGSHRGNSDCSLCLTRPSKYQCTWCGNTCTYSNSCPNKFSECPAPRIDMIKPLSGPIEGGTLVTIEGSNLGRREKDIMGKISIGNVPCELVNYEISVKIECRTGPVFHEMNAPVKVANEAGYTESNVQFQFKDIQLSGLEPTMGPQSGGTQITLIGKYLNIGSQIKAYLDNYECMINITQSSSSRLACSTSRAGMAEPIKELTLSVDGANRTFSCAQNKFLSYHAYHKCSIFNYTQDPRIMQIKPLKSFASGGRMVTVHGSNLDSILKPEMEVFHGAERINKTFCVVLDSNQMECPSPGINEKYEFFKKSLDKDTNFGNPEYSIEVAALKNLREPQMNLQIGFILDNVETVKDMSKHFQDVRSTIVYVDDPNYFEFPDYLKLYKGDTLVIEGEHLNIASDETDVNVTIGTLPCNVTSLALNQLVCTPPEKQPAATDENGFETSKNLPLVVVRVGKTLRFPIGHLKYEILKPYSLSNAMVALGILSLFISIALVVMILAVYRRKSTQAEREYKRIQIQMDTLESNVRLECKQAFAELQTDMTDLTADLESSGIPTLDHINYIMKVFFPGVSDHPVLNSPKLRINLPRTNYDSAMLQFEQLISNKYFVLVFIETLEAQEGFNIRDKVNVASLLMIVLMNKMEYATDILKSLLLRLIDKSVTAKHPQLMLRRTESVVEKMLTNYMAICMYDYLKEYAGSSLFLLFKAIKHQTEKGLVDAVTNEARYSLSEEKLLREQVPHSFVSLHIVQDDLDEKVQCKVLDCDTISQVKSKILDALFKNTPFSMRPAVYEVDLEWRHGRGGHLTLQDEDLTTKTINGWKRLNTLSHYGVKESAVMSLIARQNDSYNMNYNSKHPQSYHNFYYINNSQSHIINGDIESGLQQPRVYHLVKPMLPPDQHMNLKNSGISSGLISNPQIMTQSSMERTHKAIPEIFLTRLLATKGTIQKFVYDFFATILTVNAELPPAVKWLFDLLDEAAKRHNISDPEIVHAWKSNSLPLRFWVNFIKNPDFIFDINKTPTVDTCLSVIAQTFMDACSNKEHRLGKDSPSNKLLFAKDIPQYREMVKQFYYEVARLPQISDQEMGTAMQQLSVQQCEEFDAIAALKELYIYVTKYRKQIMTALNDDINCKKMYLTHKLDSVACTLESDENPTC